MFPTWLMVKQHKVTKLKYFCKTVCEDPIAYKGSGKLWKRHLKNHGPEVVTLWCRLFTDRQELTDFAMKFSVENDIANSDDWANLIHENGLDGGGNVGLPMSDAQRHKLCDKWLITNPEGYSFEIYNMLEFCRENKLNPSAMSGVARGNRSSHKGYWCKKLTNNRNVVYDHKVYQKETKEEKSRRLSEQATRGKFHHEAKKVTYKGKKYGSIADAMVDNGVSYYLVRKYGEYDE